MNAVRFVVPQQSRTLLEMRDCALGLRLFKEGEDIIKEGDRAEEHGTWMGVGVGRETFPQMFSPTGKNGEREFHKWQAGKPWH